MTIVHSILLGIIQGFTEFIPISSSGHLIIARELLHIPSVDGLAYDAVLQLATAMAAIVYFRSDIKRMVVAVWNYLMKRSVSIADETLIKALVIGTVPAIVAGLILEGYIETIFRSTWLVAVALLFGSAIIYLAEYTNKTKSYDESLTPIKGFVVGLFQCLALVPGISRSGATISGGLFAGLSRESAARFSFLLSIPIIVGSGSKKLLDLIMNDTNFDFFSLFIGSATAFVVGLVSIYFLMTFLKKNSMMVFVWYRVVLAVALLIFFA